MANISILTAIMPIVPGSQQYVFHPLCRNRRTTITYIEKCTSNNTIYTYTQSFGAHKKTTRIRDSVLF